MRFHSSALLFVGATSFVASTPVKSNLRFDKRASSNSTITDVLAEASYLNESVAYSICAISYQSFTAVAALGTVKTIPGCAALGIGSPSSPSVVLPSSSSTLPSYSSSTLPSSSSTTSGAAATESSIFVYYPTVGSTYGGSTYNPSDSSSSDICPAGYYSDSGYAPCNPCYYNSFSAEAGSTVCTTCPAGTQSLTAASLCDTCLAGQASRSGYSCTDCFSGSSSPEGGSYCTLCPAGTVAASNGDVCKPCPVNTFASGIGNTQCTNCPANTIGPNPGASDSITCHPIFNVMIQQFDTILYLVSGYGQTGNYASFVTSGQGDVPVYALRVYSPVPLSAAGVRNLIPINPPYKSAFPNPALALPKAPDPGPFGKYNGDGQITTAPLQDNIAYFSGVSDAYSTQRNVALPGDGHPAETKVWYVDNTFVNGRYSLSAHILVENGVTVTPNARFINYAGNANEIEFNPSYQFAAQLFLVPATS